MPPTATKLLTVEEYAKIPNPPGGHYELHHGGLVFVPPPKFRHFRLQNHLLTLLKRICMGWFVSMEFPFRPLPEYEVWVADIAMVPDQRFRTISDEGWLEGSPDLVIEVFSPSNTEQEMSDRERICFQGGCREFWLVYPKPQLIRVSTPDGITRTYQIGDEIPWTDSFQKNWL